MTTRGRDWVLRRLRPARRLAARFVAHEAVGLPPPGTVRPGSRPRRVKAVQRMVNRSGVTRLRVDGAYGARTRTAVKGLQRALRLPATGLADPLTVSLGMAHTEPRRYRLPLPAPPSPRQGARRVPLRELIMEAPPHQYMPRKLQASGLAPLEPETTACFLALMDQLGPRGLVFDVGANMGAFSYLAQAVMGWEVVAFEPTPDLASTVRRVAEINGLSIRLEERAVGRFSGAATFYLSDKSDLSSSLNPDFRPSTTQLVVPVESLDDFVARSGLVPSVVKIDVESTDADVLGGARRLIEEHRPWVFVEVLDDERGAAIQAEIDHFGYHLYPLRTSRLPMRPDPRLAATDEGTQWNWLLAPEPVDEAFSARVAGWRAAIAACGRPPQ